MARKRSRFLWLGIAVALEVLLIFVIPVAVDLRVPVSPSMCPPPAVHAEKRLVGSLEVTVANLVMKLKGFKTLEPFIDIVEQGNRTVRLWLGNFANGTASLRGWSKVVENFVGPTPFSIDVGENRSGLLFPPTEVYYDPSDEAYVFQYFYPGTSMLATLLVKPMYRKAFVELNATRSLRAYLYLCKGEKCWLGAAKLCQPGLCLLNVTSSKPFQYTLISLAYRCGMLGIVLTSSGKVVVSARSSSELLALVTAIIVAATVCIGIVKTKRFK